MGLGPLVILWIDFFELVVEIQRATFYFYF